MKKVFSLNVFKTMGGVKARFQGLFLWLEKSSRKVGGFKFPSSKRSLIGFLLPILGCVGWVALIGGPGEVRHSIEKRLPYFQSQSRDLDALYLAGQLFARKMDVLHLEGDEIQAVLNGFKDWAKEKKSKVNSKNINIQVSRFYEERLLEFTRLEKEKGDQYLNKFIQSGGKKTENGLGFRVLSPGSALHPHPEDGVEVEYHGSLIDGRVFDSTAERKTPSKFSLNRMIPGWREGLPLIGEGGEIELVIPSNLAYGDRGSDPVIPGGATLHFKVKLLKVLRK